MKIKSSMFFISLLALTPLTAIAEVGDIHTVKTDNAIVRDGPGQDSAQVDKLGNGTEIMEMAVQGDWYEIYVADTDLSGWMHVSTLEILGGADAETAIQEAITSPSESSPKPAPAQAAKPVPQPSSATRISVKSDGKKSGLLKDFEKYLVKYNSRTNVLKGYVPFTGAVDSGSGELQLTVTKNWLEKSKARQKSSLITIYSRWKRANPTIPNVKVTALDQSGNQVVEYPN